MLDYAVNKTCLMPNTDEFSAVYQELSVKYRILKVVQNVRIIIMYDATQTFAFRPLGLSVVLPEVCLLFATSRRNIRQKVI